MVPRERETQMYEFGPFRLDSADRLLMRDGEVVALPPKVLDTLLVLVENSGHVLEKEDLLKRLWPDTFVEEGSLTRNISYLRKALGESDSARQYIETIPRRGYRFIAPVKLAGTGLNEIAARQPNEIDSSRTEAEGDLAGRAFDLPALGSGQDRRPGSVNGFHGSNGLAHREEFAGTFSTPGTILNRPWRSGRWMLVTTSVAVPLFLIAWWLYQTSGWNRPADGWASSASKLRLDKLTHTGQAKIPALSTDGKWVAYVQDDGHLSSVWLRQTANGSQVQIVPPADASYQGLTFSRDGDYLYYVVYEKGQTFGALYQISILGGVARRIINDVDSPVAFSPDGRQLAFVRNYPGRGETILLVAGADGGNEKAIVARAHPFPFLLTGPSWSPDGQVIACGARHEDGNGSFADIVLVNIKDGTVKPLTVQQGSEKWINIGQLVWLRDGSGILAVAWQQQTLTFADQVWFFPYPAGEPQRVTNDANTYAGLGLMANERMLVTSQFARETSIEVTGAADTSRARKIASGLVGSANVTLGVDWTPDGRIVYSSDARGHSDIWVMNADGSNQQQLTDDTPTDLSPSVSADGHSIVFVSYRTGASSLWRMDIDGRNLRQLTGESGVDTPSFSPDGRWVVYECYGRAKPVICKIPADGGAPTQLTDIYSFRPVVSPDGKWLAFYFYDNQSQAPKIGMIPFENESGLPGSRDVIKAFGNLPRLRFPILKWAADGRSLIYGLTQTGVSNLWRQPLDGSPPSQITAFKEGRIFSIALARDGNQLAWERGKVMSDIVLISSPSNSSMR